MPTGTVSQFSENIAAIPSSSSSAETSSSTLVSLAIESKFLQVKMWTALGRVLFFADGERLQTASLKVGAKLKLFSDNAGRVLSAKLRVLNRNMTFRQCFGGLDVTAKN